MVAHKQVCDSAQRLGQTLPAQMCVFEIPLEVFVSSLTVLPSELQTRSSRCCLWEALLSPGLHSCPADFGSLFQPCPRCRPGLCHCHSNVAAQEAKCAVMDSFLYQWKFCSVLVLLLRREEHAGSVFLAMLVIIRQNHPIMGCYIAI